jgi:hypothetical protein
MSYAAPFYYAAKALEYDRYVPGQHPRPVKQRRRRIRLVLFPALRPTGSTTSVAPAASSGSR